MIISDSCRSVVTGIGDCSHKKSYNDNTDSSLRFMRVVSNLYSKLHVHRST